jgi:hypothetical protein
MGAKCVNVCMPVFVMIGRLDSAWIIIRVHARQHCRVAEQPLRFLTHLFGVLHDAFEVLNFQGHSHEEHSQGKLMHTCVSPSRPQFCDRR